MEDKHTINDLYQMQSLPLSAKVQMTRQRVRGWISEYGEDGVYVAFSGGKDSTVLLDIIRKDYPDVEAVYVDTGLEYPEIRDFVKTFENVKILKPQMNFREVIKEYGYPFISKEVSGVVDATVKYYQKHPEVKQAIDSGDIEEDAKHWAVKRILGEYKAPIRVVKIEGAFPNMDNGQKSMFNKERYKFLIDAPFKISDKCCMVMKKNPSHKYTKQTGKKPITAQMASESKQRTAQWIKNGCNGFHMKSPISNPMSFWTEQDVLLYIKLNDLPICSVYGDIVEDTEIQGQMNIFDYEGTANKELFESDYPKLKTTKCKRTGCMFCGYGAHCKDDTRFVDMKETHPKTYEWIMKPWKEGGLNYKEVIDWINENGNLNIKY